MIRKASRAGKLAMIRKLSPRDKLVMIRKPSPQEQFGYDPQSNTTERIGCVSQGSRRSQWLRSANPAHRGTLAMIGKARLRERIGCVSQKQSPQPLAMICKACPGSKLAMFRKAPAGVDWL